MFKWRQDVINIIKTDICCLGEKHEKKFLEFFYQYAGNGTYLYAFDFIVAGISPMAFSRIFLVALRGSLCFIVGRRYLLFIGLFFLDERGRGRG